MRSTYSRVNRGNISTYLVILLTIIALTAGWILKDVVAGRAELYNRAGVSASIPLKWAVQNGLAGESLIFTANPLLDRDQRFQVSILPAIPGGKVTDVVVARNLSQGQSLPFYKVSSQQAVQFRSRNGYQVSYSYIKTDNPGGIPVVITGLDIYFETPTKVLLVTFENSALHFDETLPAFYDFLESVTYQIGDQP